MIAEEITTEMPNQLLDADWLKRCEFQLPSALRRPVNSIVRRHHGREEKGRMVKYTAIVKKVRDWWND